MRLGWTCLLIWLVKAFWLSAGSFSCGTFRFGGGHFCVRETETFLSTVFRVPYTECRGWNNLLQCFSSLRAALPMPFRLYVLSMCVAWTSSTTTIRSVSLRWGSDVHLHPVRLNSDPRVNGSKPTKNRKENDFSRSGDVRRRAYISCWICFC